jgi:aryl-alcohol dehydrogenase-like predicted oxidoreductase
MARPSVTAPIVSATSLKQLAEVMQAVQLKLSGEDVQALDKASA